MTDDPQPGYDFFVSPPAAAPPRPVSRNPRPASTRPASTRPVTTRPVTTRPAGARPASTVLANRSWALNPDTFSTQDVTWRMPGWARAGITILGLLLIGSLAAAIAVPIVKQNTLNAQYEHTKISLPKDFNGQQGASSASTQRQLTSFAAGFASMKTRIYGKQTLGLVLIVALRPKSAMSDQDQSDARARLSKRLTEGTNTGLKLNLTPAGDPGKLGGYFGCGKVAPATVCIGTDPGSMVAIVLGPTVKKPQSLALKLREVSITRA